MPRPSASAATSPFFRCWGSGFRSGSGFLVAVAIIIVVSIVIGWICFKFRLKEFYFAVVTLAFAELCRLVALNWTSVTNGTLGMLVLEKPTVWLPGSGVVKIEQTVPWYFLTLVCL